MKRNMKTMDGNNAAAHASYAFTDVAAIYPITPSSVMAEVTDEWAVQGRENIFGRTVAVTEMQSEAGVAGAVHGSLAVGALTTTFTASQGLLLMMPNLYKMAGELLPGVFQVAARSIATHALSIFGDHSDIYACRQTGVAMLSSSSVQEAMDLTPVAHCCALKGRIPFIHFFDGFRTSHEMQKIEVWDYEDLKDLIDRDALQSFRANALSPNNPKQMGSAQNPDIFFQGREAANTYYDELPQLVQEYMDKINKKIGTNYKLFDYYGDKEATHVIIAMGSVCQTSEETVDFLNRNGMKVGIVKVHLYRPFCQQALLDAIPESVEQITVLDRTKEPGSIGEPLYLDVIAALRDTKFHNTPVFTGRYGLGSKDTTPAQVTAVYKNTEKKRFTVGIEDDITNLSLQVDEQINTAPEQLISCKFWGLGSDGTVGANKNSIKIIGDNTDRYVQAYFDYDSKKSGGITVSHLRFGHTPIKSSYLINKADFVACHNAAYIYKYHMVEDLKDGGVFLLNCPYDEESLKEKLPAQVKRYMAKHHIKFYIIDGIKIGKEIGLGGRINTILQSAFFRLANIIPEEEAISLMKAAAKASYENKGTKIVEMNYQAIDRGATGYIEIKVPEEWLDATEEGSEHNTNISDIQNPNERSATNCESCLQAKAKIEDFVEHVQIPMNAQEGNKLPVSSFTKSVDGSIPSGSSAYERRSIAVDIPVWNPENCIQCCRCSYVCPHATIRPVALTQEELEKGPEGMNVLPMNGMPGYSFQITISAADCTGCGSCASVCPGKQNNKALVMENMQENKGCQVYFDYGKSLPQKQDVIAKFKETTVKGSQFKQPLLEFSGACAGCGETPYAKLVTQLFGDRMYIANATGCSSIWGNSAPSTPYTTNKEGQGPAWSNSLFEDAAEFGFGMSLAQKTLREGLKEKTHKLVEETNHIELGMSAAKWMETYDNGALNGSATDKFIEDLKDCSSELCLDILKDKDYLSKKSQWIFGGDGWAYDIGFGGLDHVIASGADVNILVFDTEAYSNTGGQSSKSTPFGAIAQFASGGKAVGKKDLAGIAMSYGYVYVAQIAMGADYNQCVKAIVEAESFPGPSLIIAYSPCIVQGIKAGMSNAQLEEKKAVEAGYWHCFRYNPALAAEGKPAFIIDSKAPVGNYREFLNGEVRYSSLIQKNPEGTEAILQKAEDDAAKRYQYLKKLVTLYGATEENER